MQEAFVRAYAAGSRFTRVQHPEAWLRQTALDLQRNRWRMLRNFERIKHQVPPLDERSDDRPQELAGLGEHAEVVDALRRLPEQQRVVLVLHYLADRRVDQIAAELGIAVGTVKSRLSRARVAMAEILEDADRT